MAIYPFRIASAIICFLLVAAELSAAGSSMELPRMKKSRKSSDLPQVAKGAATVDDLASRGDIGAREGSRNNCSYLSLQAESLLTRPLKGSQTSITFVSFLVYASEDTKINIGGATISAGLSERAGFLRLRLYYSGGVTPSWRPLDEAKLEPYEGVALAAFPILTIRLNSQSGLWDLYVNNRMAAEDIPLDRTRAANERAFSVKAGRTGAWLCGLVQSDENPLFVDANSNGIDDDFEKTLGGTLLSQELSASGRLAVIEKWKAAQRANGSKSWTLTRPLPDR